MLADRSLAEYVGTAYALRADRVVGRRRIADGSWAALSHTYLQGAFHLGPDDVDETVMARYDRQRPLRAIRELR